jgi:hypothetical protein
MGSVPPAGCTSTASHGFDFSDADRGPVDLYNEVLWAGLMEGTPYPRHRSGLTLRANNDAGK